MAFLGEIRLFGGDHAPDGWHLCDGALLRIQEYSSLFALLGTYYGGDGATTFGLPDLRGRAPVHTSATYPMGELGGCEKVVPSQAQMPAHTHAFPASTLAATLSTPTGNVLGATPSNEKFYLTDTSTAVAMAPAAIGSYEGGGQQHENMQPFMTMCYIIAMEGLFPALD